MSKFYAYLTTIVIWLTVIGVGYGYFVNRELFQSIGDMIVSLAPFIAFFLMAIIILTRDIKYKKRAEQRQEFSRHVQLFWGQSIQHDLLMYLTPALILAIPFVNSTIPDVSDVVQACSAYLAMAYLKVSYWKEL